MSDKTKKEIVKRIEELEYKELNARNERYDLIDELQEICSHSPEVMATEKDDGSPDMMIECYKVFNPDWTCRGFKYEVGKTYTHDGDMELCKAGFHACKKLIDCFLYYNFNPLNKVAKVNLYGEVLSDGKKTCASKIKIVEEISWHDVLEMVNIGHRNVGRHNVGHSNVGNYNVGRHNVGNYNVGHHNVGHRNVGRHNVGHCNVGRHNVGNYNVGHGNTGFFNTYTPTVRMFNRDTGMAFYDVKIPEIFNKLQTVIWVDSENMTAEEKSENTNWETIGGYLKIIPYKEAWQNLLKDVDKKTKDEIKAMPNFDKDIFCEITGVMID
jgi:hypothetical protein